ncbi:tetratricopeptide repeat protein [Geodermatophilus sp. YIM 151500]|uniref:tetratricopeptide repeat protein n=1 Tax=Geodermatophilus sp. YIM 151500 TaxID=2984531 RepID=UPI0021E4F6FF|nr:tetratricopeptide repeat protein [Geodermatophilus sp. YIM 151500]MCV2490552.1 tetratricopeptide repeat protein [Geodermatophilus sp. YIM 151500]
MTSRRTAVSALATGVLLLLVAAAVVARSSAVPRPAAEPVGATGAATGTVPDDPLAATITAAQRRLTDLPGDWRTWAELGGAYVEQARITADPSYYAKAEGALRRSLELRPEGNDLALARTGALANARHDFAAAADAAQRALAVDPYDAVAWGVLTDARTQLGDYPGATEALDRMLTLQPGVASFTRAAYDAELHGRGADARAALEQALDRATGPSDTAFVRTWLGMLALSTGDLDAAERHFAAGSAAAPGSAEPVLGRARVLAAREQHGAAVEAYRSVVAARPLPEHLVEFGEYLLHLGRDAEAAEQFALVGTVRQLFDAGGVRDDLGTALFEADHGDPAAAVAAAEREFAVRQSIDAHDALAWALHSAGRDGEALEHARAATALGGRNATFVYHRGAIEAALGRTEEARASLAEALEVNRSFSPLHAPRAEQLLDSLGGPP